MGSLNLVVVGIIVVYLIAMLLIGWYSSTKVKSNSDFIVAGRRLGPILMAGTLAATEIGGGSSLGVVEKAYGKWGIDASWYIIAMGITFVILTILAPKFRSSNVKTVPEFFRRRYNGTAGLFTAITMLVPLIGLTAAQIKASATIISALLGFNFSTAVIVVSVVITVYAVMGGLWSVTLTDFVQVFLIVIGMALAIPFALTTIGGWDNVVAALPPQKLQMAHNLSLKEIIGLVVMYLATFTVGQEAVSRFYAARDEKAAVQGSIIAAIVNFVYAFIPTVLGLITLALVTTNKVDGNLILKSGEKYALPLLAMNTMPSVIVGLLFAGIISATMSSADSDLLGAGSIFGNDIYKQYINKNASSNQVLKVTKNTMVLVGILGMLLALIQSVDIISLLTISFSLRAAGSFIPYVAGHYWKKSSSFGTILSLVGASLAFIMLEIGKVNILGWPPIVSSIIISALLFIIGCNINPHHKNSNELTYEEEI